MPLRPSQLLKEIEDLAELARDKTSFGNTGLLYVEWAESLKRAFLTDQLSEEEARAQYAELSALVDKLRA